MEYTYTTHLDMDTRHVNNIYMTSSVSLIFILLHTNLRGT